MRSTSTISCIRWASRSMSAAVLDLGTGGGFPGMPLAVESPDARFTLCDSIGKKIRVAPES